MTKQEFTQRVGGFPVTDAEFEAINTVYMNCDLEKDDFCKEWLKINKKRIAEYKAQAKRNQAMSDADFVLYCTLEMLRNGNFTWDDREKYTATDFLAKSEVSKLEKVGYPVASWSLGDLADVCYAKFQK